MNPGETFTAGVAGRELAFQTGWGDVDDYGESYLTDVVIWGDAHGLADVEILWWARVYLDTAPAPELVSYWEWEDALGDMDPEDVWPAFGDDTGRWVRRTWARWLVDRHGDGAARRWEEFPEPRDGFQPAAVVTLGGTPG